MSSNPDDRQGTPTVPNGDPAPASEPAPRTARAQIESMDVALLKQGGLYSVSVASGQTYRVDVVAETCSCPDFQHREPEDGCKHVRRVRLALEAGTVPRPDGKLPAEAVADPSDSSYSATAEGYQQTQAGVIDAIREREDNIATLQAEIDALQTTLEILQTVEDPDESFDLDAIRPDQEW